MYDIILPCLIKNLEGFAKNISDTLASKRDASDLAIGVKKVTDEMGRNIMTMLMETMDDSKALALKEAVESSYPIGEQADIVKQMIEDEFSLEDKVAINEIYRKLIGFVESDSKKEEIEKA